MPNTEHVYFTSGEADKDNFEMQIDCKRRMEVFDRMPKDVRNRANLVGEPVVDDWLEREEQSKYISLADFWRM